MELLEGTKSRRKFLACAAASTVGMYRSTLSFGSERIEIRPTRSLVVSTRSPFVPSDRDTFLGDPAGALEIDRIGLQYPNGAGFGTNGFRGRTLIVNFWAYWCPECISEFGSLVRLQASQAGRLAVVLVSDPKNWEQDVAFAQAHSISFPLLRYSSSTDARVLVRVLQGRLNGNRITYGLPVTYVFSPAGRAELAVIGTQNWMDSANQPFWPAIASE